MQQRLLLLASVVGSLSIRYGVVWCNLRAQLHREGRRRSALHRNLHHHVHSHGIGATVPQLWWTSSLLRYVHSLGISAQVYL